MRTDFRVKVKFFCADPLTLLLKLTLQWTLRVIKLILLFRSTFDGLFQSSIKHSHLVLTPPLSLSLVCISVSFFCPSMGKFNTELLHNPLRFSIWLSIFFSLSLPYSTYVHWHWQWPIKWLSFSVGCRCCCCGQWCTDHHKMETQNFSKICFYEFLGDDSFLCLSRENAKRFLRFDFGETK